MSAFTPGPWKFGLLGTQALWVGPGHDQAFVVRLDFNIDDDREKTRANAQLIAAAPELLAAVLQYRDDLRHPLTDDSRTRRLARIDTIIDKATSV